jgi:hypothetical protein
MIAAAGVRWVTGTCRRRRRRSMRRCGKFWWGDTIARTDSCRFPRTDRRFCRFCRVACPFARQGRDPRQRRRDTARVLRHFVVREGRHMIEQDPRRQSVRSSALPPRPVVEIPGQVNVERVLAANPTGEMNRRPRSSHVHLPTEDSPARLAHDSTVEVVKTSGRRSSLRRPRTSPPRAESHQGR